MRRDCGNFSGPAARASDIAQDYRPRQTEVPVNKRIVPTVFGLLIYLSAAAGPAASTSEEPSAPHTPKLVYYLAGPMDSKDAQAIGAYVAKLKTAKIIEINTERAYAHIQFDSHVVSYHQVAQAIADAGASLGKKYDPCLIFTIPDYSKGNNAAGADAIFAGKRLRQRVNVIPIDKSKGKFAIHFLPLKVDPATAAPQGFNGGHLHHPISDPAPRGLGIESSYEEQAEPTTKPALGR
jgi:hypothetical protein